MRNEDKDKVSILVPVYNAERYLAKCIECLIIQKYDNLEILLVDDGSTDMSGTICDCYSHRDTRIRVIHQKNMGVASSRNIGIKNATGKYVCFVDADDWIPKNSIYDMVNGICENNVDLCVGSIVRIFPQTKIKMNVMDKLVLMSDLRSVAEEIFRKESPLVFVAAKLYRIDIIRTFDLKYDENMKLFEDACFVFSYLNFCTSIKFINKNVYYYNQLMNISASRKSYLEYNKWAYLRYCKQIELIGDYKDSLQGKRILDAELIRIFNESCSHYVNSMLSDELVNQKIKENIEIYIPMISYEGKKSVDNRLVEAIKTSHYVDIKNYYIKSPVVSTSTTLYRIKTLVKFLRRELMQYFIFDLRIEERLSVLWRKYGTKNKRNHA